MPIAPGTYAQPLSVSTPRPYLHLVVGDVDLTADGSLSGSFAIADLQASGGDAMADLQSVLVSFDLVVPGNNGSTSVVGCVRYTQDPAPVFALPLSSAASGSDLLAECSGANDAFYVDGEGGYPGFSGATRLSPETASFSAGLIGPTVELQVVSGDTTWQLQETASLFQNVPLATGTYTAGATGNGPTIQLVRTPGSGCISSPTGSFGVVSIDAGPYAVTKLVTWFDLHCDTTGSLRGCAANGN